MKLKLINECEKRLTEIHNKELIAASTLETLNLISKKATDALSQARSNPASSVAQLHTWNDANTIRAGSVVSQKLVNGYESLVNEPALARISVVDDSGANTVYYFARQSTVSGVANLSNYKAPIGSLASQDIGDTYLLPNGKEVEVIEKLILNPQQYAGVWDSKRTRAFFEGETPQVIDSLRALLTNLSDEEEFDPFAEWDSEQKEPDNGLSKDPLRGVGLRDRAILDKTQDELFRVPLNAQLMLTGPPGTGKTTTLIKRLGQKLQLPEEMLEDQDIIQRSRQFNSIEHKNSWLMFTPTSLLELYLREAFGKEGVPSDNSKITTWEAFCEPLSKDQFGLLRGGSRGGGFILKPEAIHETTKATNSLINWFDSFFSWQSHAFLVQLTEAAKLLASTDDADLESKGVRALQILDIKSEKNLVLAFIELKDTAEELQLWIKQRRTTIRDRLDRHLSRQINRDRSFASQFLQFIDSLVRDDVEAELEDEDLLQEETPTRVTSRGEQLAF